MKNLSKAQRSAIARKAVETRRRNAMLRGPHSAGVAARGSSGRSTRPTFVPSTIPGNAALSKKLDRVFDAIVLGLKANGVDVTPLFPQPPAPKPEPTPEERFRAEMEALAKKFGVDVASLSKPGGISEDVAQAVVEAGDAKPETK